MADNGTKGGRRILLPLLLLVLAGAGAIAGSRLAARDTRPAQLADAPDASTEAAVSPDKPDADAAAGRIPAAGSDRPASDPRDADTAAGPGTGSSAPAARTAPAPARRVMVSIEQRRLWLIDGTDTLMSAPVAIGMGKDFTYNGRQYHFSTPRGERTVVAKSKDPLWTPPEWHYYEKAAKLGLDSVVRLDEHARIMLRDSSWLVVQDHQVGRINHFGYFSPLTPGTEIVFDGIMYIPPSGTAQRHVPDALGPYKLDMGDGYLIHGTHVYNMESIGEAVSHGCVRMRNEDLTRLYPLVPRGTKVVIF